MAENIRRKSVAYDVGANVGFYSLIFARLVGPEGEVVAFEPSGRNLALLHKHIRRNHLSNVRVIEAAVSDTAGTVRFEPGASSSTGRISDGGTVKVRAVQLDELVMSGELPLPDCMKIDVEGAELLVLRGCANILRDAKPLLFLATHGAEVRNSCETFLKQYGYVLEPIDDDYADFVARPQ